MSTRVQRRRGTTTEHAAFTGADGELTVDTDRHTVVVHDGVTLGGFPLATQTVVNVKEYGASGNGITDDTAAIQLAIDALSSNGHLLFPANHTYRITGTPTLTNKTNITIVAHGAKITLSGTNAMWLKFSGTNTDITVLGGWIVGDGTAASNQQAIGTAVNPAAGQVNTHIHIEGQRIQSVARGVYFDVGTVGEATHITYRNITLDTIVGTVSGKGYGLVLSGINYGSIIGCHTDLTERHAIYVSVCTFVRVMDCFVRRHRNGIGTDSTIAGLSVARSSHVEVVACQFDACEDGAAELRSDETASAGTSYNLKLIGCSFRDSVHRSLYIGNSNPSTSDDLIGVVVANNNFMAAASATDAREVIRVQQGKRVSIVGNVFDLNRSYSVTKTNIYVLAPDGAAYTTDILIADNQTLMSRTGGGEVYNVLIGTSLCTAGSPIQIQNNQHSVGSGLYGVVYAAARTSTSIDVRGNSEYDQLGGGISGPTFPFGGAIRVSNGTATWSSGAGSPEGVLTAPVGSLYTRTDGGASTTLYIKETGTGNTGWVAK